MTNVKKGGQAQLFTSSFLELFTKTNPAIHVITYGGAICYFLYLNTLPLAETFFFFCLGIFTWTLMEYLLHRYLFHIKAKRFQYIIHGVHHEFPRDKERLLMPPLPGLLLLSSLFGIFYIFLRQYNFAFMGGLLLGYMAYTFIHYIVHTWKPVRGLKFLWAHHHKHHNPVFEDKAYGVSSPFWDIVFGTMPPKNHHSEKI